MNYLTVDFKDAFVDYIRIDRLVTPKNFLMK
jgi:hypothetical protein